MLNSGKKFALCATKKIKSPSLEISGKKILNETKNHTPPPFKLNGRSLSGALLKWFLVEDGRHRRLSLLLL
jgi:hypothetical protein